MALRKEPVIKYLLGRGPGAGANTVIVPLAVSTSLTCKQSELQIVLDKQFSNCASVTLQDVLVAVLNTHSKKSKVIRFVPPKPKKQRFVMCGVLCKVETNDRSSCSE